MAAPSNDTGKSQERCHKNIGRRTEFGADGENDGRETAILVSENGGSWGERNQLCIRPF